MPAHYTTVTQVISELCEETERNYELTTASKSINNRRNLTKCKTKMYVCKRFAGTERVNALTHYTVH